MLISYDKNFLFVHVPKTAGTSLSAALRPYRGRQEDSVWARLVRRLPLIKPGYRYVRFDARTHCSILKAKNILPPAVFNQLFKFSFVRHPVDWQLSMFKHILRFENQPDFPVKQFEVVYKYRDFGEYIRWRIDTGAVPQMTPLLDTDGRFLVNFVGRVESMDVDFQTICGRAGIAASLPRMNAGPSDQQVSVSRETLGEIREAYDDDFRAFGYNESGVEEDWNFDPSMSYPSAASVLERFGGENFDPWRC